MLALLETKQEIRGKQSRSRKSLWVMPATRGFQRKPTVFIVPGWWVGIGDPLVSPLFPPRPEHVTLELFKAVTDSSDFHTEYQTALISQTPSGAPQWVIFYPDSQSLSNRYSAPTLRPSLHVFHVYIAVGSPEELRKLQGKLTVIGRVQKRTAHSLVSLISKEICAQ